MRPIDSGNLLDATGAEMAADLAPLVPNAPAPAAPSQEQPMDTADPAPAAGKRLERDLEISYFKGQLGQAQPTRLPGVLYDNPDAGVPTTTETKENKVPNDAPAADATPSPGNGSAAGSAAAQKTSGVSASQPGVAVQLPLPDANLKKPDDKVVHQLDKELKTAMSNFQDATRKLEEAKKDLTKKEAQEKAAWDKYGSPTAPAVARAREERQKAEQAIPGLQNKIDQAQAAVDSKLQDIVKAYGLQSEYTGGLHFDPNLGKTNPTDTADTRGTSTSISATAISQGATYVADTSLHESNHVRRNEELAALNIDKEKFPDTGKVLGIYNALGEIESYQLEIKSANKTGFDEKKVRSDEGHLRDYFKELKANGGGDFIKLLTGRDPATLDFDNIKPEELEKLVKNDKFDEAFQKFRDNIQLNPKSDKYEWKK